ncbi:MAG: phosphopantetheine-binding protein [Sulfurimonadaceae bacterium]|jgi:acyl carrier protein|nr:phosphopantetheine-binding protein [Sulfurimonadaceae bacterium]
MQREDIFIKITQIIQKATSNPTLILTEKMELEDIENWDSLTTVDVEMEIENIFSVDFEIGEFKETPNIESLLDLISSKLS